METCGSGRGRYLLGEVVVLVVRHAGGDVVYDLGGGRGVVRRGLPRAAVPLEAPHEAAVSGEVHLRGQSSNPGVTTPLGAQLRDPRFAKCPSQLQLKVPHCMHFSNMHVSFPEGMFSLLFSASC